jgi:hemerythrin-like domain-containing protein
MALVHNSIIRILNCIYLQAPNVKEVKDISDFTTFMHAWVVLIHEHHGNEEKFFFPWLEEEIGVENYMAKCVEQHHAFDPGFKEFEAYVNALIEKKEVYDASRVLKIIDEFGPLLTVHLKDEITAFEELQSLGDKINWKKWNKKVSDLAVKTAATVGAYFPNQFVLD